MLKEDPSDVSVAALCAISQALVIIATNNSTVAPPTLPLAQGSFIPSKNAIIVNTLWFMSLSLSIGTAFLAMLAKDWSYSFLSHHTGHPQDQAHRRQRKWKLIERWKMQGFILLLPSMVHLSLCEFAQINPFFPPSHSPPV
ncbi:hypothetical protein OPQ81_000702 [Rhizoctonia solani]|nr:hypothetical protein OPQ81_000702 [Rhizoctonia solani]